MIIANLHKPFALARAVRAAICGLLTNFMNRIEGYTVYPSVARKPASLYYKINLLLHQKRFLKLHRQALGQSGLSTIVYTCTKSNDYSNNSQRNFQMERPNGL